jgi:hypothetical protein
MILLECLSTAQLLFDEEKGMLGRFDFEDLVHIHLRICLRDESGAREYLFEIENGNIVVKGVRGSDDMVFRIVFEKGTEFAYSFKYLHVHFVA